jgi:hypothetical protein
VGVGEVSDLGGVGYGGRKIFYVGVNDKGFISFAAEKLEQEDEAGGRESDETVQ